MNDSETRRTMVTFWTIGSIVALTVAVVTYFLPAVAVPLAIIYTTESAGRAVLRRADRREHGRLPP